jgi:hypothetical protein
MAVTNINLPRDLQEFLSGSRESDIAKAEQLLNAFQNLKLTITINGTPQVANCTVQIVGGVAVLNITI